MEDLRNPKEETGKDENTRMTSKEYIQNAIRTEAPIQGHPLYPNLDKSKLRILHAALGCVTEAGELADTLKKHLFYNKKLDLVNLEEEAGDLCWYIAILADELGVSFEYLWERNIAKLKARYPDKFTEERAVNRNLEVERKILEGNL